MDCQYSEENSMESHTEDDNSITTEERDEYSPEEEQSSITTENSSEEEIDPWSTLINDPASKVRDQYDDILQALLMEGHDESEAKQEAFEKILPVFQGMDESVEKRSHQQKDPINKKIMATRDDYVNNNMFDPDEAIFFKSTTTKIFSAIENRENLVGVRKKVGVFCVVHADFFLFRIRNIHKPFQTVPTMLIRLISLFVSLDVLRYTTINMKMNQHNC